jgi:hypothetical protein
MEPMPRVVDDNLVPDMGRITLELRLDGAGGFGERAAMRRLRR